MRDHAPAARLRPGARPLRRLVQSAIGDRLARGILAGDLVDGDTVTVDVAYDATLDTSTLEVTARH